MSNSNSSVYFIFITLFVFLLLSPFVYDTTGKGCENGEVTTGSSVCQKCRLGKHGTINGVCNSCVKGKISSKEGQGDCVPCETGYIPNNDRTAFPNNDDESTGCVSLYNNTSLIQSTVPVLLY